MVKWVIRTPGEPAPQYDSGRDDLFTIEMHFNGLLTVTNNLYGSVACFDRVDPDFLSMIELNAMADLVKVEGDFYQFLWPHPQTGIADGLESIECEDHVLAFIKARQNIDDNGISMGAPFGVMTLYVKKLSEFEARKRIGEIKMELHRPAIERRVQFRLEEMNDQGDVEDRAEVVHSSVVGNIHIGVNASDVSDMAVTRITLDSTEVPPQTTTVEVNDTEVPPETTTVEVNDIEVPPQTTTVEVNETEVPPETTTVEVNDTEVPPETTTVEVNDTEVPPETTTVEVNDTEVPPETADAVVNNSQIFP
ncbi:hypothetical protein LINPERPRIM_LOCUS24429 [Linum perenne]